MKALLKDLQKQLVQLQDEGLFKKERAIASPQADEIVMQDGRKMINLCANNYLGLANHPDLCKAAVQSVGKYGFGLASVRFICGTQTIHLELEKDL